MMKNKLNADDNYESYRDHPQTKEEKAKDDAALEFVRNAPDSFYHNAHNMEIKRRHDEAVRKNEEQLRKEGKIK